LFLYFLIYTVYGIIWGVATNTVIRNKNYNENWFLWGFFFGFIAFIVALTKPENHNYIDCYSYYYNKGNTKTKYEHLEKIYNSLIDTQLPIVTSKNTKENVISEVHEIKLTDVVQETAADKISDYIVISIETMGLQTDACEIIEIAAIKFNNFFPTECFTTLLKSKETIPKEVTKISGITNEMLLLKPHFNEIVEPLTSFIGDYNLVGYKLRSDLKILYKNGYNSTITKRNYFDTFELAKKIFNKQKILNTSLNNSKNSPFTNLNNIENYELETLCKYTGIPDLGVHRALNNSLVTGILFCILVKEITE